MSGLDDLLVELTSGDELRAEAAVPGLVAKGAMAFPALQRLLDSPEVDHRWWAVRVLAQMTSPKLEWLLNALQDQAAEVRQCAALGLCSHPDIRSIPLLVRALSDSDTMVSSLASKALVAIGQPAGPTLIEALEQAPQAARVNILRTLSEIKDYRAVPTLMAALEEDSALMQHWAERGLERLGLDMVYLTPN
jgi:HEAT repeat protein